MKVPNETVSQAWPPVSGPWRYKLNQAPKSTQVVFKNILFATDFSSTAELALPYVAEIARRYGSTVHAVHVIQSDVYPMTTPFEWRKIVREQEEAHCDRLQQLEEGLRDIPHSFVFQEGDIWTKLIATIEAKHIDLLVMGTHGHTGIGKILMGSVAEQVFRAAAGPVLTVGPAVISKAPGVAGSRFNRILYATDFSPESLAAARYAISLANEHRAELSLMHAIEEIEPGQINSRFQTLQDVIPFGMLLTVKPKFIVERGAPAEAILDVAAREDSDVIVIGVKRAEGRALVATRFVETIAYQVVTQAGCPVLTIRS